MGEDPENTQKETLGTRADVEVISACKRRIKATVPAEKVQEELDRNYRELTETVQLPGFRKGKVPRRMLEARFGSDVESDVKSALLSNSFSEVMEEKQLKVVGSPKFDNVQFGKDSDLSYEVELEVRPEFELPEYKGIEVHAEETPVTDEDVEKELQSLRQNRGYLAPVEASSAQAGDVFTGKYHLIRDGVRVKTSDVVEFIPASKRLEAFTVDDLPQRVEAWGRSSEQPLQIDVKVPPEYPDEVLRGADLKLEFFLDEAKRVEYPELDEDFAKGFGKSSMAEVREEIRKSLEARSRRKQSAKLEEQILDKVLAATSMELPEGLLEGQRERWRALKEHELMVEQGLNAEQVKEALQKQGEEREEDLRRRLKATFVLEKIADQEKVFATEEEVDNRIQLLAGLYGVPYSRLRDEMESTDRIEELRFSLREEKARAFLVSQARVVGPGGSEAPAAEETLAGEAPAAEETLAGEAPAAEETLAGEAPAAEETLAGEAPAAETTTPSAEGPGSAQEGSPSQG